VAFDHGRVHYLLQGGELQTLELCNGTTPRNQVLQSCSLAEALLEQLWDDGLLVGSERRVRRFAMTGLGVEVSGLQPILAWLYRQIRWTFHPLAIGVAATLAAAGLVIAVAQSVIGVHWPLEHQPGQAMLLLLAVALATTAVHELAHAAVIVRGGRTVDSIGAGFYWGALAFFTDSTDAYFLTKPRRLAQAGAGIFADAVLAAFAVLLSVALSGAPATFWHQVAVLIYLRVALNATPVLELDGYWLISDLLDRPNLRVESKGALRSLPAHRNSASFRLAGYALLSTLFGAVLLTTGIYTTWGSFHRLVLALWNGGFGNQLLVILFVAPVIVALGALVVGQIGKLTARIDPSG
jgi:putative peptide zinc metalloprotease protein